MTPEDVVRACRDGAYLPLTKPNLPSVLPVLDAYYSIPGRGMGGSVHVIVEDDNTDQIIADACMVDSALRRWSEDRLNDDCDVFMAWLIARLSSTQRHKLYMNHGYPGEIPDKAEAIALFWSEARSFMEGRS